MDDVCVEDVCELHPELDFLYPLVVPLSVQESLIVHEWLETYYVESK